MYVKLLKKDEKQLISLQKLCIDDCEQHMYLN